METWQFEVREITESTLRTAETSRCTFTLAARVALGGCRTLDSYVGRSVQTRPRNMWYDIIS